MRKIRAVVTALALTAAGSVVPASTGQAHAGSTQGPGCVRFWNNDARLGNMYAFAGGDCSFLLGFSEGNDPNWADGSGPFTGSDNDAASSVMNAGNTGSDIPDVVAFYLHVGYPHADGYGCLARNEQYADALWTTSTGSPTPAARTASE